MNICKVYDSCIWWMLYIEAASAGLTAKGTYLKHVLVALIMIFVDDICIDNNCFKKLEMNSNENFLFLKYNFFLCFYFSDFN